MHGEASPQAGPYAVPGKQSGGDAQLFGSVKHKLQLIKVLGIPRVQARLAHQILVLIVPAPMRRIVLPRCCRWHGPEASRSSHVAPPADWPRRLIVYPRHSSRHSRSAHRLPHPFGGGAHRLRYGLSSRSHETNYPGMLPDLWTEQGVSHA